MKVKGPTPHYPILSSDLTVWAVWSGPVIFCSLLQSIGMSSLPVTVAVGIALFSFFFFLLVQDNLAEEKVCHLCAQADVKGDVENKSSVKIHMGLMA